MREYYVDEDSKINIKIFDLAGDFVDELNDNAQGGMDNETVWNVSNIQRTFRVEFILQG